MKPVLLGAVAHKRDTFFSKAQPVLANFNDILHGTSGDYYLPNGHEKFKV